MTSWLTHVFELGKRGAKFSAYCFAIDSILALLSHLFSASFKKELNIYLFIFLQRPQYKINYLPKNKKRLKIQHKLCR